MIDHIEEPMVKADIMVPKDYVGNIMEICQERRGKMLHMEYITETRVNLHYEMPLNEVIYDFFDALKSKTRGYGSLDYEFDRYEPSKLVKLDILLNKDLVDAFSMIVHESKAYSRGRFVCSKAEGDHPDAPVRGADPGVHRTEGHRPRNGQRIQKGCYCQVLRRRYFEKEKAAGKAEGREKANASVRHGRGAAGGIYCGIEI